MPPRVPTFGQYMIPLLDALRALGGSATVDELYNHVTAAMKLTEEQLAAMHDPERPTGQTEIAYRMAWARTYLKNAGLISSSERGVWALTEQAANAGHTDEKALIREVQARFRAAREATIPGGDKDGGSEDAPERPSDGPPEDGWRKRVIEAVQAMSPTAFERLCQRLLRESGFTQVNVTGRSDDKGIDGVGVLRLHGVLSFHVIFQCKRWRTSVDPATVRDFRGAMVGRTDKGLIMTTSTFTRKAREEALRDGAPPIDLVDGEQLADLLKQLKLGVRTEMVEEVSVDVGWFAAL